MMSAKYIGLEVIKATISSAVLDSTGKLAIALCSAGFGLAHHRRYFNEQPHMRPNGAGGEPFCAGYMPRLSPRASPSRSPLGSCKDVR
jgi:hypothetical protein